ncbi:MAG TPA: FtsX-like permease family protein [Nitrososphaeraceae archaeon]|jgi:putative ABC transport system permease protein|nr:FtsX-like permease family protein [Nitrososphaeraceae archaeon]
MDFKEIILLSLDAIKERKTKSLLTIVMVMVGSSLMIAVSGMGAGFTEFFNKQTSNLAGNIMFINPAPQTQNGETGPGGGNNAAPPPVAKITLNSAVAKRLSSLPLVKEVIPSYQSQVTIESKGESKDFAIFSLNPQKLRIIAPTLEYEEGSVVRSNDPSAMIVSSDVAFPPGESTPFLSLGQTVQVLYSFVDPITGNREIETKSFVIRAIIKQSGNPNIDKAVIINEQIGNTLLHKSGKFDALIVVALSPDNIDSIEIEIRKLYGNDIGITTVKALIQTIKEFTGGLSAFLLSIAIVSLIVGAVGIITTLYTSVIERTREIGTLKAIGARNFDILTLFLVEALLIGILGATSGLGTGVILGYILNTGFSSNSGGNNSAPVFLITDMTRVWLITVGLSFLAGLFPAFKASRLLPIEALKRE